MALIITAVVVVAAIVVVVRRYPFEIFIWTTRNNLKKAGLQRKTLDDLVYWVSGGQPPSAVPLVFLHGTNDQAGTWASVVDKFIGSHRLILPDLPGHGESAPATGPLNIKQMSDGLARVLDVESPDEPAIIVGNSMGGWAAMLFAIEHPDRVKKLVLEDSGGMTWDLTGVPLVPQTREQAATAMRLVLGPTAALPPNYVLDAMVRRANRSPMLRMLQGNSLPYLIDQRFGEIKAPVTMIWGDGDGVVPIAYANKMHALIDGARLHVIKECGHIPHRQKPQEFSETLGEAIRV